MFEEEMARLQMWGFCFRSFCLFNTNMSIRHLSKRKRSSLFEGKKLMMEHETLSYY